MKTKEQVSDKVKDLIEKNMDAYEGYIKASENTDNMHLRDYFIDHATDRKSFANELTYQLKAYNPEVEVDAEGSLLGSLHRSWINIKTILTGTSDESILEECIRGDRASADEYEEYIKGYAEACPEITSMIEKQLNKIVDDLDNQDRLKAIL